MTSSPPSSAILPCNCHQRLPHLLRGRTSSQRASGRARRIPTSHHHQQRTISSSSSSSSSFSPAITRIRLSPQHKTRLANASFLSAFLFSIFTVSYLSGNEATRLPCPARPNGTGQRADDGTDTSPASTSSMTASMQRIAQRDAADPIANPNPRNSSRLGRTPTMEEGSSRAATSATIQDPHKSQRIQDDNNDDDQHRVPSATNQPSPPRRYQGPSVMLAEWIQEFRRKH